MRNATSTELVVSTALLLHKPNRVKVNCSVSRSPFDYARISVNCSFFLGCEKSHYHFQCTRHFFFTHERHWLMRARHLVYALTLLIYVYMSYQYALTSQVNACTSFGLRVDAPDLCAHVISIRADVTDVCVHVIPICADVSHLCVHVIPNTR